jgi:hypothetical protein
MVWYPVFVLYYIAVLTSYSLFLIDSSQGTMKISLAFGLAQQPDREVVDKVRDGIKRSCSSRHTQTWNTRRTRTPCKTSHPFETHKSGRPKSLEGRNDNRSDSRSDSRSDNREPVIHANREHYPSPGFLGRNKPKSRDTGRWR